MKSKFQCNLWLPVGVRETQGGMSQYVPPTELHELGFTLATSRKPLPAQFEGFQQHWANCRQREDELMEKRGNQVNLT
jgi:hypothetical protein